MIAYDLDGTLCTETPARWWERPLFWLFGDAWGRVRKAWEKPILIPEGEYIIITSRVVTIGHWYRTLKWLKKYGYQYAALIMKQPCNVQEDTEYKASQCGGWMVTTYYENDPKIAEYLRQEVPGMEVVEV